MNIKKVASISLDSFLSSLKPRQLESIKYNQAPQLILAGAGTGKTTTITAKIAYMVEKDEKLLTKLFKEAR
ncbi:MAG: UvrD-helicase domain-containing protein [Methanobacteriota archaeon]